MMRGIDLGFVYFLMSSTSLSAGEHAGAMTQFVLWLLMSLVICTVPCTIIMAPPCSTLQSPGAPDISTLSPSSFLAFLTRLE